MSAGRPHLAAQCSDVCTFGSFGSTHSTLAPSFSACTSTSWSPISAALIRSVSGVTDLGLLADAAAGVGAGVGAGAGAGAGVAAGVGAGAGVAAAGLSLIHISEPTRRS
eukprot:2056524-Prymnesium_polylepis.1